MVFCISQYVYVYIVSANIPIDHMYIYEATCMKIRSGSRDDCTLVVKVVEIDEAMLSMNV